MSDVEEQAVMTEKLLPCPFCGGTDLHIQTERRDVPADSMGRGTSAGSVSREVIWCHACGAFPHGPEWWNKRAKT